MSRVSSLLSRSFLFSFSFSLSFSLALLRPVSHLLFRSTFYFHASVYFSSGAAHVASLSCLLPRHDRALVHLGNAPLDPADAASPRRYDSTATLFPWHPLGWSGSQAHWTRIVIVVTMLRFEALLLRSFSQLPTLRSIVRSLVRYDYRSLVRRRRVPVRGLPPGEHNFDPVTTHTVGPLGIFPNTQRSARDLLLPTSTYTRLRHEVVSRIVSQLR